MMAIIMDGRALSDWLKPELTQHANELREKHNCAPMLAAIHIGDNPASRQYERNKRRFAEELGFRTQMGTMPAPEPPPERLLAEITTLKPDQTLTASPLQLPIRLNL